MSIEHCSTNIRAMDIEMQHEDDEDEFERLGSYQRASGPSRRAGSHLDSWGQDSKSEADWAAETAAAERMRAGQRHLDERKKQEQDFELAPPIEPVPPFFDPSVHGDPIFSLDGNGNKVPHPMYNSLNRFYTNTPPGQTIPHFYSVYQKPTRLPGSHSTKDVLTHAQRNPTHGTVLAWEHMIHMFMKHTGASRQLAVEYLQYYRELQVAVRGFFDDVEERNNPADDDTKVPLLALTKAAIAAAVQAGDTTIVARVSAAAAAAAAVAAAAAAAASASSGIFILAPRHNIEHTEKIAVFCQCTNGTTAVAKHYIEMFPGPVQEAIDAYISHNEQDGTAAQIPQLPTPQVPSEEENIKKFEELSGEAHRETAIRYLHDYGSPRSAAEAWKLGSDTDDELMDAAAGEDAPVTANSTLVLQFLGITGADVATCEFYLAKFHNRIADAVPAYCADQEAISKEPKDVSAGSGV